jgi:hypothetical protein
MLPVSQATSIRYPPGTLLGGRYEVLRPTLTWTPSPSMFADGYDVFQATESGGQYNLMAYVPGRDSIEYADGEVGLGETYFYLVRATAGRRTSASV